MIKKGIRVDDLPEYLKRYHFDGYPYVQHSIRFEYGCLLNYFIQVEGCDGP